MAMKSLEDAFLMELQDILHAERQILKALPNSTVSLSPKLVLQLGQDFTGAMVINSGEFVPS